jgi:hypothetical protein
MSKLVNGNLVLSSSDLEFAELVLSAFQAGGCVAIKNLMSTLDARDLLMIEYVVWRHIALRIMSNDPENTMKLSLSCVINTLIDIVADIVYT